MANKRDKLVPENDGEFRGFMNQIKLVFKLLGDSRVSPILKLLPIGSLIYFVIPTDLMPGIPIDDALVVGLGTVMFVELCDPDIVDEHKDALMRSVDATWRDPIRKTPDPDISEADIIEGEYREHK